MALLRCFTCIRVGDKCKNESGIALLVKGDDLDRDDDDDDQFYHNKIISQRLSLDYKDRGDDHVDGGYFLSGLGTRRFTWGEIDRLKRYSKGVAIKFYKGRELQVYKHELEILLLVDHPNIVKLLGFCDDQEIGVLVLKRIGNETLKDRLSRSMDYDVLSWRGRIKIAYQLSLAIEYLHEKCPRQIIHGGIEPSSVLLDEQLDSKLWNFRSAKIGTQGGSLSCSTDQFVLNCPGYTDFHYLSTGMALKQHDIYSFGIIVLELITGIEAPCLHGRGSVESQVVSMLSDDAMLVKMVDPCLGKDFDMEETRAMASISAMCLHKLPSFRPSASDVVLQMRNTIHSINLNQQNELQREQYHCV